MWVGMVRGGHSSGGPADLETLRKETRLLLEKPPGGVRLEAHWEVRLAAVHVEAQREEARYTVLGALSRSPAAPTTTLGPLSTPKSTENTGPFVGMPFVWVCGLKHPGNPELRFKPRFSRFLNDVTQGKDSGPPGPGFCCCRHQKRSGSPAVPDSSRLGLPHGTAERRRGRGGPDPGGGGKQLRIA